MADNAKPYNPGPWNFKPDGKLYDAKGALIYDKGNPQLEGSRQLIEQSPQLFDALALMFDHFCNEFEPGDVTESHEALNQQFRAVYIKSRKALLDANPNHKFKPPST